MAQSPNPAPDQLLLVGLDAHQRSLIAGAVAGDGFRTTLADTGEQAIASYRRHAPAAVVADVRLDGMSGYQLCQELRRNYGDAVAIVLVFEPATDPQDRITALLLGADDYSVKPIDPYDLLARLRRLLVRAASLDRSAHELTQRELEVLILLADGRSRAEIASDLVISPKTVATHVRHILDKLGASTRAQAVAFALRENLIPPPRN